MQWRKLAIGAFELSAIPVIAALSAIPRRQFNLPWLVGSSEFLAIRSEYVAWQDRHFEVIEQGAPWLHLIGRDVHETCSGGAPRSPALLDFSPRRGPGVGCARHVAAVYGFDGPEAERLRSLELAFPAAGWETGTRGLTGSWADISDAVLSRAPDALPAHRRWMAYRYTNLRWRPSAVIGHPSYGEGAPPWGDDRPPFAPHMRVSWLGVGQEITAMRDPNRTSNVTRNRLPLENSSVQLPELLDEAMRQYDHAMSVTMDLTYYANASPRSRPHRVRRHLLPTR
jgi:hypothetical protein